MSVFYVDTNNHLDDKPQMECVEDQCQTQTESQSILANFWPKAMEEIRAIAHLDLKQQVLPLARIKKIMKLDEDVKMISAEAPLLFAKAAEIFIQELTLRAWVHTEDNKRRTLQRNDIAMAVSKYDQFDFLIDIVPREEIKLKTRDDIATGALLRSPHAASASTTPVNSTSEQVYYFQLAQQHHANLQQTTGAAGVTAAGNTGASPAVQIIQASPNVDNTITLDHSQEAGATTVMTQSGGTTNAATPIMIQAGGSQASASQPTNVQIVQQIVTANGEIQQIPINLTPQHLQMIKMQLQGNSSQPVIIQTAPITAASATAAVQPQVIQVTAPPSQQHSGQTVYLTTAPNSVNDANDANEINN